MSCKPELPLGRVPAIGLVSKNFSFTDTNLSGEELIIKLFFYSLLNQKREKGFSILIDDKYQLLLFLY